MSDFEDDEYWSEDEPFKGRARHLFDFATEPFSRSIPGVYQCNECNGCFRYTVVEFIQRVGMILAIPSREYFERERRLESERFRALVEEHGLCECDYHFDWANPRFLGAYASEGVDLDVSHEGESDASDVE